MIHKEIDLTNRPMEPIRMIKTFGGTNGKESYAVTNRFLVRNGKACFPVMGEFHFSRYPAEYWEESLLKMKSGGIDVVSVYVFWNHHEEVQGHFEWSGNKNLSGFVKLCGTCGLRVMLRIGPWAHGECRYGGFPDWLVAMKIPLRVNDERYLSLVRKFYAEIFRQVKGLLFFDGGPIIGIQLENEYGHCGGLQGEPGKEHIRMLKKIALETGFHVPFYTTTGWGNGVVVEGETLPVLGGYAEAPWEQHIHERKAEPGYLFRTVHTDTDIGTDLAAGNAGQYSYDVTRYPYFTAELGGGIEPTHHRRPMINGDDTGALAMIFLGSGAALLGYYMYHGGTNPIGRFSTLQESKATGSENNVPELSYDFQAPLGEYGKCRESYGRLKAIHLFLHDFGEEMAEAMCSLPPDNAKNAEDTKNLRYSVRFSEKGGFLFLSNYQRRRRMTEKDVNIHIRYPHGECDFEQIHLADSDYFFYPFHLQLGGLKLISAQAQLLCRLSGRKNTTYVFFCKDGESARYQLQSDGIQDIQSDLANLKAEKGIYEITVEKDQWNQAIPIVLKSGETANILTISREDAYRAWKIRSGDGDRLILTDACLYTSDGTLHLVSDDSKIKLSVYPDIPKIVSEQGLLHCGDGICGCFQSYVLQCREPERPARISKITERKSDGGMSCTFSIERSKGKDINDDFLTVHFSGDRARLFIDDTFSADWFYNGLEWKIGLKRFGNLDGKIIRLQIEALHEDDFVFLEKKPEFQNGTVCSVQNISIEPEFHATLKWDGVL